jgi:two-component system sensor histidine kinase HydH
MRASGAGPLQIAAVRSDNVTRGTLIAVLILVALAAGVVVGAAALIERDRAALAAKFAGERLTQVAEAADVTRKDLESVGVSLNFAGQLVQGADSSTGLERELTALLAATEQYRRISVYASDGRRTAGVAHPRFAALPDLSEQRLAEAARLSLSRAPGELEMSAAFTLADGKYFRTFSTALARGGAPAGAVAVLVDTERLFAKLRFLGADPSVRLLFLGPHGKPTSSSDERLARAARSEPNPMTPQFAALMEELKAHRQGTLWISEGEVAQLEIGDAEVLAAFAPVVINGREQWALATLTSTSVLESAQQALLQRLSTAAAAIALLLSAFGVFVVVTARRAAVAHERLVHAEGLAQLHEKTEKILDTIPTGVMTLSAELKVTAVNRALREKVLPAFAGKGVGEVFPEAPGAVVGRLTALLEEGLKKGDVCSLHGARLALFGQEGQYSIHAVPLGPKFAEARVLLVIEDVSEVKSLESQLLRAEKLATIGVLTAGLAHEIGTPLGVVRGRAEYIQSKLGMNHPQAEGMGVIVGQIDRVTRIIRQMLDFSRVKPAQVQSVHVGAVISSVVELLRLETTRRTIFLSGEVGPSVVPIAADPDQLEQTLINLTLNACDASVAGGHVELRAERAVGPERAGWGMVRITVTDEGCGIQPSDREAVFDPFFTTKKRGQGTGLGLSVAAQIVRNHGGQIELESELGRGTRVIVLWPAAADAAEVGANGHPG